MASLGGGGMFRVLTMLRCRHLLGAYMEKCLICKRCRRNFWCKCGVENDREEAGDKVEQ